MRSILVKCRALSLGLILLTSQALAALPDPVAFSWALELGDVDKVRGWLDEGLDPEFQGQYIGTGLMSAAWYGNVEMMELFVERGADPRRANRVGEQALQLAAWNGHLEAVKWLLEHGATANRDGNHWGALHYAVFNGHRELARYLIERGADVDARSPNGSTPLMMAAREGREELAKLLLEAGADTKPSNDWGDTALILSMRYDHYRLGKLISSPEEFDVAVKAPKEDFGVSSRSAPAPNEIEELLASIREAEATGRSGEYPRARLRQRIMEMRAQAVVRRETKRAPPPYRPNSVVITARRNRFGGERAQITAKGRTAGKAASVPARRGKAASPVKAAPDRRNAGQARIAELMRQIRLTEAQGRSAQALRQELYEAVEALK
ncbi:MAG: ankyrin repeat domain-containing protein [Candidatus Accumulibacter sp.]|nr:ankyrin repeat domain-containing protein [Accumulibacter sp.]